MPKVMMKCWWKLPLAAAVLVLSVVGSNGEIPTTLDGPFDPVTSPLDHKKFRGLAVDLPDSDPRVQWQARGFEPEQISISLSTTPDSIWISWVTGFGQFCGETPVRQ
ncbi:purple acid phosphatase 15-like [Phoenix dactylifera]|uniref:Purple acid phosphatase 15-like n=1 Tax=Phoenix dactylifera TaxID=42345 RepID=A0A8B9B1V5_PHODC|nr:purple acid phosphatase 15-like [Phoenix dactylifera]